MPRIKAQSTKQRYEMACQDENTAIKMAARMILSISGMTHSQFADAMSVSKPTLEKWLKDPGTMRVSDLRMMKYVGQKYNVTIDFLDKEN